MGMTCSWIGLAAALLAAGATALAAPPEIRGTWLTTTGNDAIASPQKSAQTMRRLRDIGLNTVYVECWKNGYTEFPSPTMDLLVGVPLKVNAAPASLQRDLLQETLIEAHRNGLHYVAWFEYGFMAAHQGTDNELSRRTEWLTRTRDGRLVGDQNPFVWMNPLHPGPQQLLIDIMSEAVRRYDLDGIQLDDRIAWPVEMGYDDYTRQVYAREHGGASPPDDPRDPAWIRWRADKVSDFARRLVAELRRINPRLVISVSPAPFPWCYENYACDWPAWSRWDQRGGQTWDEYVTQNYRFDFAATRASIEQQFEPVGPRRGDLVAGLRIVGDGPDMPWSDLRQSIEFCRAGALGGHVHWFSRGVLEVYPEQLKAFYNVADLGHAPHPRLAPRPAPIEAAKDADGTWKAAPPAGRYRVIARVDGTWSEVGALDADAATPRTIDAPASATHVELLEDRRPRR